MIENIISFIYESLFMLALVFLMGLSQDNILFKEVFVFYMGMVISTSFLFFNSEGARFNVFRLIFPQMTFFQIKTLMWSNFMMAERFLQSKLKRLLRGVLL